MQSPLLRRILQRELCLLQSARQWPCKTSQLPLVYQDGQLLPSAERLIGLEVPVQSGACEVVRSNDALDFFPKKG